MSKTAPWTPPNPNKWTPPPGQKFNTRPRTYGLGSLHIIKRPDEFSGPGTVSLIDTFGKSFEDVLKWIKSNGDIPEETMSIITFSHDNTKLLAIKKGDNEFEYISTGKSIVIKDTWGKYHAWNKRRFDLYIRPLLAI